MHFNFFNEQGIELSGRLEMPDEDPKAFAIFAHCFTCSKNLSVTSTITRSLAKVGIATLRFDFTGIGNSDGDFSNTNFSSNVQDLLSAYKALSEKYKAPTILIGHSLGGAAVLKASTILKDLKAIVTIGAPSCTQHLEHMFTKNIDKIMQKGEAEVELAGRKFKIKKQFIEDIKEANVLDGLSKQNKAYLIMHSPIDETVSVEHAGKIYQALKHPKSFISLDQVDHLLTRRSDSEYVAGIIHAWLKRYFE